MWFRAFLAVCSAVLSLLLGWLAAHTSSHVQLLGRYSFRYFGLLVGVAAALFASALIHIPSFYSRVHRVRWRMIGLLAILVLPFVAAELAIRTLDPLGISHLEESSRLLADYVSDPVLGYRLPPGAQGRYQGVTISTNRFGLRDRDLEQKQDGELRILLLGDSITFGWGVAADETYGRKLESLLESRLGRRVRTVNAGVGGSNTVQEYALFKRDVAAIDPDLVVLLYVPNDIQSSNPNFDPRSQSDLDGKAPQETVRILLERSWLYRLVRFVLSDVDPSGLTSFDKYARGVRDSMNALAGIAGLCRERHIQFDTFFYREKQRPDPKSPYLDQLLAEVSHVGNTQGFRVSDTRPWWGDLDRRSVTISVVDWHPNARGHDILAGGIASVLISGDSRMARKIPSRW
jgi:hypothetical protein